MSGVKVADERRGVKLQERESHSTPAIRPGHGELLLNVTVPTLNEEKCLASNVRRLVAFLNELPAVTYEVVIADNGSTDATLPLAQELADELKPRARARPSKA